MRCEVIETTYTSNLVNDVFVFNEQETETHEYLVPSQLSEMLYRAILFGQKHANLIHEYSFKVTCMDEEPNRVIFESYTRSKP